MKFLVDAQLPHLLAIRIRELGHSARHTLDLCGGNISNFQLLGLFESQISLIVSSLEQSRLVELNRRGLVIRG